MPSFTPEQKAFIEKIVYEAGPIIVQRHVDSCPWGKKLMKFMYIGVGIGVCLGALGLSTIPGLIRFIFNR